jgi:adenylate kinase
VIPGVRLIMLGRQGAGKGTQCVRLAHHYVVPHVSTGDMLRAAAKEGTPFGLKAKELMDRGDLLPDDVMIGIVAERLARDDTRTRGYILDGFPRTVAQAESLIEICGRKPIDVCLDLQVPRDLVLKRLAARRVCETCGTNYSTSAPPTVNWTCDVCGGHVVQRADDTEDAINRRLDLYDRQTKPLTDFYRARDELAEVDGVGSPDDVLERLVAVIGMRARPQGRAR